MKRYAKNQHPYIYTAFPADKAEAVMPLLTALNAEGVRFWYAEAFKRSEKRKIAGAFGVLLFVTAAFAQEPRFRQTVDAAVACGQKILCVYLEPVQPTPWLTMQLGSQQDMRLDMPEEAFVAKLKEAFIFREMEVTAAQKRFQRNKAISLAVTPILAAAVLFFAVINPLLIAPKQRMDALAKQWGFTAEDLAGITELYILGDEVMELECSGYFESNDRSQIICNRVVDGNNEDIGYIPTGTLTSGDLEILQYMPNLEKLSICGNQITDISPLFCLSNLKMLILDANPITSLEGIGALQKLEDVRLTTTDITDPSPLWDCPNLRLVMLDITNISQINGIERLQKLEHLNIQDTYVSDVSMLSEIQTLSLLIANSTYIDALPEIHTTEDVHIETRGLVLSDYSVLKNVNSFRELSVQDATLSQLLPLIEGKPIEHFAWSGTKINSPQSLHKVIVTEGGYLGLAHSAMTSLDGIEHFEGIRELDLRGSSAISDLTPLRNLKSLEYCVLSEKLRDLAQVQLQGVSFKIDFADA